MKQPSLLLQFTLTVPVCRGKRLSCAVDVMDYFGNFPDPDLTRLEQN